MISYTSAEGLLKYQCLQSKIKTKKTGRSGVPQRVEKGQKTHMNEVISPELKNLLKKELDNGDMNFQSQIKVSGEFTLLALSFSFCKMCAFTQEIKKKKSQQAEVFLKACAIRLSLDTTV